MDDVWPFVGRSDQVGRITACFRRAETAGVLLAGEAGTGKTRLARAALSRLGDTARTQWAAGTRSAAAIPFGAVSHLLPDQWSPAGDRLASLRSAVQHVQAFGGRARVAVGIDDAHLLDDGSATLVHQLATQQAAFVLLTADLSGPLPDAVGALWKDGALSRMDVPALTSQDVDACLDAALPGQIDGITRRWLKQTAAGNPMLLRELVRAGRETGALYPRDGVWRYRPAELGWPVRLTDLVARRLPTVRGPAREVLEIVACAEPVPVRLVEEITGAAAIEVAERAGLVTVEAMAPHGRRRVLRVAHPLYAAAVRTTLPVTRSAALYRSLVDALVKTPLRRRDDVLLAGVWQLSVGAATRPELLVAAARQAVARLDLRLGERLAAFARDAGPDWEADRLHAEILEYRGRSEAAVAALPPTPEAGSGRHAMWAVTVATVLHWGSGQTAEAERVLDLPPGEPGRDLTEATRSWIQVFDGRCEPALASARAVLAMPDAADQALVWAATSGTAAAGLLGRAAESAELADRGEAAAARTGMPLSSAQIGFGRCFAAYVTGDLALAWRLAEAGYQEAVAEHGAVMAGGWSVLRGLVALVRGRPRTAVLSLREAAALLADDDTFGVHRPCFTALAAALALAGNVDEAEQWLGRADEVAHATEHRTLRPLSGLDRAWTLAARGETGRAEGTARQAAAQARQCGLPMIEARALYDVARLGGARDAADRLAELAGQVPVPLVAAFAAAAGGLAGRDAGALRAACTTFGELGFDLLAGEAASTAAQLHTAVGQSGQADLLAGLAASHLDRCEGARTPLLYDVRITSTLTPREREVVLLAAGHSSREIAALLGLSRNTVNNYLARAYAKLGITSRRELASLISGSRVVPGAPEQ